jgi:hypothetical protein
MSLYCIVYVSIATQKITEDDLKSILQAGRAHNQLAGITGILLYRDGFFIQAIEGEEEQVDTLFARLLEDPRHTNQLIIYKEPIDKRCFSEHTMGFKDLDLQAFKGVKGFSDFMQHPTPEFFVQSATEVEIFLNKFRS